MAARSLSARLCRQCCRSEAQLAQRRLASTAARPAEECVLQQRHEDTGSPVASTSKAGADEVNILASLQFEVAQSNPVPSAVWSRLHQLYTTSPSSLADHQDLLQNTIPILSQFRKPPKTAKGLSRIIAVQEEAEALYARYRFISNRFKESGIFKRNSQQQNDEFLLVWLQGIADLGYGPAAWRIWEDYKQMANVEDLTRLLRPIAHCVLIATMKWVVLQRDRDPTTTSFQAQARQCLLPANEVANFLKQADQYDWIARSITIRILKESESIQELMKKMKDEFAFDANFPSWIPFDAETGVEHIPAAKLMDPHSINTMLYRFAMECDLSKMISLFETAISHPAASKARLQSDKQALPFFSSSNPGFPSTSNMKASPIDTRPESTPAEESALHEEDRQVKHTLQLDNVNTQSFELLIEEAVNYGKIYLAHHYLKLCITAWKQERSRLRSAYEPLFRWSGESEDQQALVKLIDRIQAPRVSVSVHAFYPIYMKLKHSKNEKMRYAPVLESCLRLAEDCLDHLHQDTLFFAKAHDQLLKVEAALLPESAKQLSYRRLKQKLGNFGKEIDLRTHALLQTRLQVELGELARFIEAASIDVLINRKLDSLLFKLSVARPMPSVDDDYQGYTILIDRLSKGIQQAEGWLANDIQQDERRFALLRSTLDLSAMQMEAKIKQKRLKYMRKRAIVSEAIITAQAAVQEAKAARREILDARETTAAAERRGATAAATQDSEQSDSSFGSSRRELQFLNASGKRQEGDTVQASLYGGGSSFVLT